MAITQQKCLDETFLSDRQQTQQSTKVAWQNYLSYGHETAKSVRLKCVSNGNKST